MLLFSHRDVSKILIMKKKFLLLKIAEIYREAQFWVGEKDSGNKDSFSTGLTRFPGVIREITK